MSMLLYHSTTVCILVYYHKEPLVRIRCSPVAWLQTSEQKATMSNLNRQFKLEKSGKRDLQNDL